MIRRRDAIKPDCPLLPVLRPHVDGECDRCGKALTGRQRRWCSGKCGAWAYNEMAKHHDWAEARRHALERDGHKCVRCGEPEKIYSHAGGRCSNLSVNHIEPRFGRGYGRGCHNHLENLETLCHPCHVIETRRQRARLPLDAEGTGLCKRRTSAA